MEDNDKYILFDLRSQLLDIERDVLEYVIRGGKLYDHTLSDFRERVDSVSEWIQKRIDSRHED